MEHYQIIENTNYKVAEAIKALQEPFSVELSIDCNTLNLPDFKIPESERLIEFELFLENIKPFKDLPCVYVFEVVTGNSKQIINAFKALKLKNKVALKKHIDFKSKTLYVGKSQKGILHRMKVHFGYKNTTEKGLQLLHWLKPLPVELKLHIHCFKTEIDFLLPLYEKELNKKLKPLIGYL